MRLKGDSERRLAVKHPHCDLPPWSGRWCLVHGCGDEAEWVVPRVDRPRETSTSSRSTCVAPYKNRLFTPRAHLLCPLHRDISRLQVAQTLSSSTAFIHYIDPLSFFGLCKITFSHSFHLQSRLVRFAITVPTS